MLETAAAAVRSLAAYVGVSLWVLLCGPPGMLLAMATGRPDALYVLGRMGVRIGLGAAGIRCRVAGREHIQLDRAAVYCVNHASNVEPPILYMALAALHPRLRILYKAQIHKLPVLGRAFDMAGFVPIERRSARRSMQAILQAAAAVRAGNSFLVFPEGTRSRTGELQPFKPGRVPDCRAGRRTAGAGGDSGHARGDAQGQSPGAAGDGQRAHRRPDRVRRRGRGRPRPWNGRAQPSRSCWSRVR